ncbi:DUF7262 family protein [Salinibaculum rarum]|uniref:DUF7262 family protein n=1 Tax=Salinibaculum rarum TaxID=3058903 RepID=UPI00266025F4|nr:hypothetical protein [Salinibaculum sp. KK48]
MARAQASLTAVEAAVGVLLLLGVTFTFALGVSSPTAGEAQLDAYADDAVTVLATENPAHGETTRLSEMVSDEDTFEREKETLVTRLERILPDNVMFRLETPYGTAGHALPDGVPTGVGTTTTRHGTVTLRVWYA